MSSTQISIADFPLFAVLWNQHVGITTPALHIEMAQWLEWNWQKKNTKLLLMTFRGGGKSTISGLFAAWLLYRNPDLRILVLAADSILARKMVRQVKKIIEKHPLTKKLVPGNPDQWAGSRFTVKRMTNLRDPSMLARGITSNITGSRADIIICDDVEVPNTCDTAEKRIDLREKLDEIDYVLTPGGTQLYLGTPHTYYSIYAGKPRADEEQEFLRGFTRLEIPIFDHEGDSVWPEKFTAHEIGQIKLRTGPNKFASQMLLKPVNIAEGRLDVRSLRPYTNELQYVKELQSLYLGDARLVSASAWWDPSFASNKGDRSVLAIIFSDDKGNLYLHRVLYLKTTDNEQDEATQQCLQVVAAARDNYLPSVTIEINGIGKFLPAILRNEMVRANVPCSVRETATTRPKELRIIEAFDAPLAAKRLFAHHDVIRSPFMQEMQEWRPITRGFDDGLDAAAGAIAQEPIRLPRLFGTGRHSWMKGAKTHKAETEFEV